MSEDNKATPTQWQVSDHNTAFYEVCDHAGYLVAKTKYKEHAELIVEAVNSYSALTEANKRMRGALESISKNTCCDKCQEAALVAKEALREEGEGKI